MTWKPHETDREAAINVLGLILGLLTIVTVFFGLAHLGVLIVEALGDA